MARLAHNAMNRLSCPSKQTPIRQRARCRIHLDADHAQARVGSGAVVLAVAEIAEPGLQHGVIVAFNECAVLDDGGRTSDGGPVAGSIDEGDVDVGVDGEFFDLV